MTVNEPAPDQISNNSGCYTMCVGGKPCPDPLCDPRVFHDQAPKP